VQSGSVKLGHPCSRDVTCPIAEFRFATGRSSAVAPGLATRGRAQDEENAASQIHNGTHFSKLQAEIAGLPYKMFSSGDGLREELTSSIHQSR